MSHHESLPTGAGESARPVTAADVHAAREIVDPAVHRTPMQSSEAFSELAGARVMLKCEHLQRTGSFKVRGALVRLARLSPEERERGVVAASAGNHAQGVAFAARRLGIDAVVHMPADAALPKVEATESYGARVVLAGDRVEDAMVRAQAQAEAEGRTYIHPFDHVDVVAGQGTVGLEILEQVPDVGTVLVPAGGGGLLAGIRAALPASVRVVAVQAERASAWAPSLASGHPVRVHTGRTMADGIAVAQPGSVPLAVLTGRDVPVVTVSEEDISRTVLALAERAKQVVEPAGAAGLAALVTRRGELAEVIETDRPVVAVLSGGNVDPIVLRKVFRYGMAAAGRYLHLRCTLTDRPGLLAGLLAVVAEAGADVVTVSHVRTGPGLGVDETAVDLEVVTKGRTHAQETLERVRDAGYGAVER